MADIRIAIKISQEGMAVFDQISTRLKLLQKQLVSSLKVPKIKGLGAATALEAKATTNQIATSIDVVKKKAEEAFARTQTLVKKTKSEFGQLLASAGLKLFYSGPLGFVTGSLALVASLNSAINKLTEKSAPRLQGFIENSADGLQEIRGFTGSILLDLEKIVGLEKIPIISNLVDSIFFIEQKIFGFNWASLLGPLLGKVFPTIAALPAHFQTLLNFFPTMLTRFALSNLFFTGLKSVFFTLGETFRLLFPAKETLSSIAIHVKDIVVNVDYLLVGRIKTLGYFVRGIGSGITSAAISVASMVTGVGSLASLAILPGLMSAANMLSGLLSFSLKPAWRFAAFLGSGPAMLKLLAVQAKAVFFEFAKVVDVHLPKLTQFLQGNVDMKAKAKSLIEFVVKTAMDALANLKKSAMDAGQAAMATLAHKKQQEAAKQEKMRIRGQNTLWEREADSVYAAWYLKQQAIADKYAAKIVVGKVKPIRALMAQHGPSVFTQVAKISLDTAQNMVIQGWRDLMSGVIASANFVKNRWQPTKARKLTEAKLAEITPLTFLRNILPPEYLTGRRPGTAVLSDPLLQQIGLFSPDYRLGRKGMLNAVSALSPDMFQNKLLSLFRGIGTAPNLASLTQKQVEVFFATLEQQIGGAIAALATKNKKIFSPELLKSLLAPAFASDIPQMRDMALRIFTNLEKTMSAYHAKMKKAGVEIPVAISLGITEASPSITKAADQALKPVSEALPHSPPKRGPLVNILKSASLISSLIASGVLSGAGTIAKAADTVLLGISKRLPHSPPALGPLVGIVSSGTKIPRLIAEGMMQGTSYLQQQAESMVAKIREPLDRVFRQGLLAERLGIGTKTAETLSFALKTVGSDLSEVEYILSQLREKMATDPNAFAKLGIDLETIKMAAEPSVELFFQLADRLAVAKVGTQEYSKILETSGIIASSTLLNLARKGSVGIRELQNQVIQNGTILSDRMIAIAAESKKTEIQFLDLFSHIKEVAYIELAPAFDAVFKSIIQFFTETNEDGINWIMRINAIFRIAGEIITSFSDVFGKVLTSFVKSPNEMLNFVKAVLGGVLDVLSVFQKQIFKIWDSILIYLLSILGQLPRLAFNVVLVVADELIADLKQKIIDSLAGFKEAIFGKRKGQFEDVLTPAQISDIVRQKEREMAIARFGISSQKEVFSAFAAEAGVVAFEEKTEDEIAKDIEHALSKLTAAERAAYHAEMQRFRREQFAMMTSINKAQSQQTLDLQSKYSAVQTEIKDQAMETLRNAQQMVSEVQKTMQESEVSIADYEKAIVRWRESVLAAAKGTALEQPVNELIAKLSDVYSRYQQLMVSQQKSVVLENAELGFDKNKTKSPVDVDLVKNETTVWEKLRETVNNVASAFENLYELSGKKAKEFFYINKMVAIASATIQGASAIINALNGPIGVPTWINIANAATIGAMVTTQIAQIVASTIQGYALGGVVSGGSGGIDDIPAKLTAGEFVQPKATVDFYGQSAMEALRQRLIPKSVMANLSANLPSLSPAMPRLAYATGGYVSGSASQAQSVSFTSVNVFDRSELDQYMASNQGQQVLVNVISQNAPRIRKLLANG